MVAHDDPGRHQPSPAIVYITPTYRIIVLGRTHAHTIHSYLYSDAIPRSFRHAKPILSIYPWTIPFTIICWTNQFMYAYGTFSNSNYDIFRYLHSISALLVLLRLCRNDIAILVFRFDRLNFINTNLPELKVENKLAISFEDTFRQEILPR